MDRRLPVKLGRPGVATLSLPLSLGKADDPGIEMKAEIALGTLLMSSSAYADSWIVAETPAAVAVSDAQAGVFRPGVMPAVGAYADNGWFALGLRLRTGVLRDGAAPGNHFRDPRLGS